MGILNGAQTFFSSLPLDWIVLSGIVIVVALDSLRSGIGRAISLTVAMPMGLFLFTLAENSLFKFTGNLTETSFAQAIVIGAFTAAMYFLVRRMGLDYVDGGMGEPVQALIAGSAVAIVFVCIWLQEPVLSDVWALSGQVQSIFSEAFRLWWLLGAYAALAFARG